MGDFNACLEDVDSVNYTSNTSSAQSSSTNTPILHQKAADASSSTSNLSKSLIDLCIVDNKLMTRVTKIEIRETTVDSDHRAIVVELETHKSRYEESTQPIVPSSRKKPRLRTLPKPGENRSGYVEKKVKALECPKDISRLEASR